MKNSFAIVTLVCVLLAGCRLGQRGDLLERDLRLQEDRIYELEDMLYECQEQLDCSRHENEILKKEAGGTDTAPYTPQLPRRTAPNGTPGRRPPAGRGAPEVQPPVIELDDAVPSLGDPARLPPREFRSGLVPGAKPEKIVLNKRLTGGLNRDGRPGDEGIMVVFEPRDVYGQLVKAPGDVSIVLLDPTQQGPAARVARWDFTADEALTHFKRTPLGPGLQFQLSWPGNPPANRDLHLFVRYSPPGGAKLVADARIDVEPTLIAKDERRPAGWAAAPPRATPVAAGAPAASQGPVASVAARPRETAERPLVVSAAAVSPESKPPVKVNPSNEPELPPRPEKPVWRPFR